MSPGTKVRMSEALKHGLRRNGSAAHVAEFGNCVGVVQGLTDYNNCKPEDPAYDPNKRGPEVDVRWEPWNLRYAYHPDDLDPVT